MGMQPKNIAVTGCSGAIGSAFVRILSEKYPDARLHAFSRSCGHRIDYACEQSLAAAARLTEADGPLDLVIVANGMLHADGVMPERALKEISGEKLHRLFQVNTVIPALIAKHFLPRLNRQKPTRFVALSARIGSISDNRLGGWHSYRASKAALNMIIKNAAIEIARHNRQAVIVGLHPGTVDSDLSKPFQDSVPDGKLFAPDQSVHRLVDVLSSLSPRHSGKCFAWDGQEIRP